MHHPERWTFDWFYKRHDMEKADNRVYRQTETERRAEELHECCRMPLDQKHAEYEDLKRCAANNTRNQGLKIETLLRGINDARALIDPIWRHRMGAEQVREHVQRGLRCIDSAITDCQFTAPTAVHASDCAMHNAPAYPAGECDCGALGPNTEVDRAGGSGRTQS